MFTSGKDSHEEKKSCGFSHLGGVGAQPLFFGLDPIAAAVSAITHLLAIIFKLTFLQAKIRFILLILYKYTLYRLKLKINTNKQSNCEFFCFAM